MTSSLDSSRNYYDTSLAAESSSLQYLLLEADQNKLKICAYHLTKSKVVGFSILPFSKGQLNSLLRDNQKIHADYEQTILSVRTNNFAVVPKTYLNSDLRSIFELTNEFNDETEVLLSYSLVNLRANVLFAVDKALLNEFKSHFSRPTIIPHVAPRIEHQLNHASKDKGQRILAHLSADFVDVLIFDEKQLLLANSFYTAGKEDVAYYVLFCAESLNIDPEKSRLILSGNVDLEDETTALLKNYWRNIESAPMLHQASVGNALPEFPNPELAYLTQSLLCAL